MHAQEREGQEEVMQFREKRGRKGKKNKLQGQS